MTTISDVQFNFPVPRLPGDECESDSDTSMSSCSSSSSISSPSSSSSSSPSCSLVTSYTVLIPFFTAEQIDGSLLRAWSVKPQTGYRGEVILVSYHLHISDLSIWRTPKRSVPKTPRSYLVKHRGKFMKSIIGAFVREDTTAASQTMIEDLNNWFLKLQTHAMTAPLGNRKVRKTTEMMVK